MRSARVVMHGRAAGDLTVFDRFRAPRRARPLLPARRRVAGRDLSPSVDRLGLPIVVSALLACVASMSTSACDPVPPPPGSEGDVDARLHDDATVDASAPVPPRDLQRWIAGDPSDAIGRPRGGIIVMGGGPDVDEAFAWQRDRIDGGDVVVLRASGADGYNPYLFDEIGGVDSVETLLVDTPALAIDPFVRWTLDRAEAIFIAGGDQAVYVDAWRGSPVVGAIAAARRRGAVVGGTSAGAMVLGEIVYAASNESVTSEAALDDPYGEDVTLERGFVTLDDLTATIIDTHFAARDRMGRLLTFAARAICDGWTARPLGLGVDEATALVVDERGVGSVLGSGAVYALAPASAPMSCQPGAPLVWEDVPLRELAVGDRIALPSGDTTVVATSLSAADGGLDPSDPY